MITIELQDTTLTTILVVQSKLTIFVAIMSVNSVYLVFFYLDNVYSPTVPFCVCSRVYVLYLILFQGAKCKVRIGKIQVVQAISFSSLKERFLVQLVFTMVSVQVHKDFHHQVVLLQSHGVLS